jgi:sarcosine oxidase subunit beta
MTTSQTYDAIVIGAGINGAATAFELARRGLKVALVERRQVGEGPSGRSSAIVRTHYSNPLTARMALFGLRVFQDFESYVGGDCGFRNAGFVVLVDARDQEGLQANMAMQRSVGIRTELLPPQDLATMVPGLVTEDLVAAAYEPESGYADPYLTVQAYAQAARRHGIPLLQGTTVTGLRMARGNVLGVATTAGNLDAPVVVNAAGPWAGPLARTAGIELPINPCRVQVAFFRRPAGHERPHPVVGDFINAT